MSRNKIGFYIPEEDDATPEKPDSSAIILRKFIEANYQPEGDPENKEFRSALELQYELSESVSVSIRAINDLLTQLGYEIKFIEGVPNWVMYKKNP